MLRNNVDFLYAIRTHSMRFYLNDGTYKTAYGVLVDISLGQNVHLLSCELVLNCDIIY